MWIYHPTHIYSQFCLIKIVDFYFDFHAKNFIAILPKRAKYIFDKWNFRKSYSEFVQKIATHYC